MDVLGLRLLKLTQQDLDDDMKSVEESENSQPQYCKRKVISVEDSDDGDDDNVFETEREDFPKPRDGGRSNASQKKKKDYGQKEEGLWDDKDDEIGMSSQPSKKNTKEGHVSDKTPSSQSKNNSNNDEQDESETDNDEENDTEQKENAKLKARKIDQLVFRKMVSKSIIQHDLPFSYVEYERVRAVWKYLNDDVQVISRNTAVADVIKYYENEKAALKRELRNLHGRISFTSDLWTAVTDEGYVCLTAHYIDSKWQLKNKILVFNALPPPHSGIKLAMHLLEMLKEWGIDKKVFSLTLDNATSNDCMQDILKSQLVLRDDLLCGGEFFHVRESIKYVTASESRDILFRRSCESARVEEKRELILDVPTRWNSTYHMLERALKYRAGFINLKTMDKNFKSSPTNEEWDRAKAICDFLEPFDEITKLISASILDPRLKLTLVQYCFERDCSFTCKTKIEHCEDFFAFRKSNVAFSGKSSLDIYLDEPPLDTTDIKSLLDWWKDNSKRFGELSSVACDVLSIPITTVASESSLASEVEF
ncbi:unnamed protein product [Microthlaspi erraticum]|uniref:HAT C-terminal dimerisation domain-containing protein n=1 Tax=Microthlaspi erraticum TaxID=1685480 RepID=A0A6D2J9U3_9BRAS|nr:unnamed protein product [Microthlaspi erraticum]